MRLDGGLFFLLSGIARYLGLHYTTISKIVKRHSQYAYNTGSSGTCLDENFLALKSFGSPFVSGQGDLRSKEHLSTSMCKY